MSDNYCGRVIQAIAQEPWAIKPNALDMILAIAQRSYSDPEAILQKRAEYLSEESLLTMRDGVAIINVMGPIFPRANLFSEISGAAAVESLALRFGEALAAPEIKAIVLHIDSPGGQVTGVHEFANQIYAAKGIKPVTAYISGMGCSAAYWIASAVDSIVADATAEIGSIGVIMAWEDDSEKRKKEGLRDYVIVSSQSPDKHIDVASDDGRKVLQERVDALADIFIADVARNRGKSAEFIQSKFGEGGTLFAAEAVTVGMIDAVGSMEGLIGELSGKIQSYGGHNMSKGRKPFASDDTEEQEEQEEQANKALEEDIPEEDDSEDPEALEDEEEGGDEESDTDPEAKTSARVEEIMDLCMLAGKDLRVARAYAKSGRSVASIRRELVEGRAAAFDQTQTTALQKAGKASTSSIVELAKQRAEQKAKRKGGF